jgi:sulfur-oxidizing protein SoxY
MKDYIRYLVVVSIVGLSAVSMSQAQSNTSDEAGTWPHLRQLYFGDRMIRPGDGVVGLEAPVRAEDAAIVPITIKDLLPANSQRRIDKVWLIIDSNPVPMSTTFDFAPSARPADIATRVRVDAYTNMRVVAQTDDGKLYMTTRFVKASGGCSAPASKDPEAALAHLGEMKLKTYDDDEPLGRPRQVQMMLRHPNHTGLQMNQLTRLYTPAHYVKQITVNYERRPVLDVKTTFSLSEDPSLRFSFQPQDPGTLTVRVLDTEGKRFAESLRIAPVSEAAAY